MNQDIKQIAEHVRELLADHTTSHMPPHLQYSNKDCMYFDIYGKYRIIFYEDHVLFVDFAPRLDAHFEYTNPEFPNNLVEFVKDYVAKNYVAF